jgi:hypothetical protein
LAAHHSEKVLGVLIEVLSFDHIATPYRILRQGVPATIAPI